MNKYTHTFVDPGLEQLYRTKNQHQILYPTFIFMSLVFILLMLIFIIEDLLDGTTQYQNYEITLAIYVSFQLLVIRKYQHLVGYGFFLINHSFLIMYIIVPQDQQAQQSYLMGQNIMILQSIILFINVYKVAIIANISLCTCRLLLVSQIAGLSFDDIVLSIIVTTFIIICQNVRELQLRTLFLLGMEDNQWEQLLPSLVSKQFALFTYDNEQLKFKLKLSNFIGDEIQHQHNLQEFLRAAQINGGTLEQHIFREVKCNINHFNVQHPSLQNLEVYYNGKCHHIVYQQFILTEITIMIILEETIKDKLREHITRYNKDLVQKLSKFLQESLKAFVVVNKYKDFRALKQLQNLFQEYWAHLLIAHKQVTMSFIDINKLVNYCLKCQHKHIQVIVRKYPTVVHSSPPLLIYLVNYILHHSESISDIKLNTVDNSHVNLMIHGQFTSFVQFKHNHFLQALKMTHISSAYTICQQSLLQNPFSQSQNACFTLQIPIHSWNSFSETCK